MSNRLGGSTRGAARTPRWLRAPGLGLDHQARTARVLADTGPGLMSAGPREAISLARREGFMVPSTTPPGRSAEDVGEPDRQAGERARVAIPCASRAAPG